MNPRLSIDNSITLNDGSEIPQLGLGVFQIAEREVCVRAVHAALDSGYRHIDTAVGYQNEEYVGQALKESKVDRDELFVTTKFMPDARDGASARKAVEKSLRALQVEFVDLYLIHWPMREGTEKAYEAMQRLREEGKLRSIGVSNFTVRRFEEQFFRRIGEVPAVNQFERHPYFPNNELIDYCREKGIQPEAYSPLAQANALKDPTLVEIGETHQKSPAQVLIRWHLQQEIVVIPKSSNPKRIRENVDVYDFQLSADEMERIAALDKAESIITCRPEDDWF
ncbi:aldo/keto reductase [Pelagicoccus sp. SDUM812002]|uniref:aldo/keto reductase n=1 Tax=Pelagicoccus sp. SDUM812002 TaxID=3041266 RepID=UPI00280F798B|nr:aldo/keto reductase [Pelagicoccus sp. SDUM812002]MDQ8188386.1 aldo/keto reductase [Pelagicoccus sp. SDUM812002]